MRGTERRAEPAAEPAAGRVGGTAKTTVEGLRRASLFGGLSEEELGWVAGLGREIRLGRGDFVAREGDPQAYFHVLLEGRVEWTRRIGQQDVLVLSHEAGTYFGHEPILMDVPVPVTGRALTPVRALRLQTPEAFWEMLSRFPHITRELLTTVTERYRTLETVSQQSAKLAALGTMAAGLAHELNNPAAAARRGAERLGELFDGLPELAISLGRSCKTPEQLGLLAGLQRDAAGYLASRSPAEVPDPVEQSDLEDEVALWLEDRGVEEAWDLAPALAGAGLGPEKLDTLARRFDDASVGAVLAWLSATLSGAGLLDEVEKSAGRISELVGAIKSYSHMDRAPVEDVDVHEGLESTLTILGHKLKVGNVAVERDYDRGLPRISAYGSELNQVWTNLIDNAVDALGGAGGGRVTLRTAREGARVLVEVADNGPGIPEGDRERIFEPFFTTKGVGEGTGLGLDVTRRIVVGHHRGDIRLRSEPGDTRFRVLLPVEIANED